MHSALKLMEILTSNNYYNQYYQTILSIKYNNNIIFFPITFYVINISHKNYTFNVCKYKNKTIFCIPYKQLP